MDLATAYQKLGIPQGASAEEVKARYRILVRRYHPDIPRTGNSQKFILINAAYTLIVDALHGRNVGEELRVPEEVISEAAIEPKISAWFTALRAEYQSFRESQVRLTKEHVSRLIQGAASGLDLKNRVKKEIEISWVEMGRKIEDYVGRLIRKAAKEDKEFLYNLFREMYEVRRKHWVETLYRNPVVIIALFVFTVLTVLAHYPRLDHASPLLFAMASTPWLLFAPIQGLVLYMLFKLWVLNPRDFEPGEAARERAEAAQAAQLRARAEAERQRQLAAQISAEFDAAERDAKRPKPYEISPGNWTCPRGYLLREGRCLGNDEIGHGPRVEYGLPGP